MRSMWLGIAVFLGLIVVVWGGWQWVEERRFGQELQHARIDMAAGHYRLARQRFAELAKSRPASSEATYQLGQCEERLEHVDAALTAWSGVAAGSPFYIPASTSRARLLMNTGRLTLAEDLLASLPHGPGTLRVGPIHELLLRIEGRSQEARDLIITSWRGAPDPGYVLKRLFILDGGAFPTDYVKDVLKVSDPEDDRVWLGQANLAIWSGRFDEAARWLDACEQRRPLDQPVWLTRLSLAVASRDVDGAGRAVKHLRADWFLPFEVLRLRAWFAAFQGDDEAERQSLLALLEVEPGNTAALARLAELALKAGQGSQAESFRVKQAKASDLHDRYTRLFMLDERSLHAEELARLAQRAGAPHRGPRLALDPGREGRDRAALARSGRRGPAGSRRRDARFPAEQFAAGRHRSRHAAIGRQHPQPAELHRRSRRSWLAVHPRQR